MEAKRYIGIDLHRDCFTACLRLENGREYLKAWKLEDMAKFTAKLRPTDEVAVEVTGNTRLFHDAVAPHVGRHRVVKQPRVAGYLYGHLVCGPQLGSELRHVLQLPCLQILSSVFQPQTRCKAVPVQIDSDVALGFHVFSSFRNVENQAE